MGSRQSFSWNRRWRLWILLSLVLVGCAGRESRETRSTLGTDLRHSPAGFTYPPPSIGVDLVRQQIGPARDASVVPAVSN